MTGKLTPYGSAENARLVAKIGHDKTPERQIGDRKVAGIRRLNQAVKD